MYSRWYNVAVVFLWLSTMSWLVTQKVLPSLLIGEPPNYQRILAAKRLTPVVAWSLAWNDRRLGWAVSSTSPGLNGLTEVNGCVHFDHLPLRDMVPGWLHEFLQPLDPMSNRLRMDARSSLVFDPLGRLSRFESAVGFQPKEDVITLKGKIEGPKLEITIHCGGGAPYELELPAPRNAMLSDALSPQSHLPGLREGQRWTVETYGTLRPPTSPIEIVHATVEAKVPVVWNGGTIHAWLVVYRSDPGSALGSAGNPRGRLWVAPDGTVVRQEIMILNSTLTFTRLPDDEAARLALLAFSNP